MPVFADVGMNQELHFTVSHASVSFYSDRYTLDVGRKSPMDPLVSVSEGLASDLHATLPWDRSWCRDDCCRP